MKLLPSVFSVSTLLAVAVSPLMVDAFAPSARVLPTIAMGSKDLKDGTTKLGEIDPVVIPSAGPDAAGTVCNQRAKGPTISAVTFSIKNGTAANVRVDGGSTVAFDSSGSTKVSLSGNPMGGNACRNYAISDLSSDASGKNLVINATPSFAAMVQGTALEVNSIRDFSFDALSDLARHGIPEMYNSGVLTTVFNQDPTQTLSGLTGTVSFPGAASANLTGIQLFESDGDVVSTTVVSVTGHSFTVSNFAAIDPGDWHTVVFVFDTPLNGEPMRAEVQATFTP